MRVYSGLKDNIRHFGLDKLSRLLEQNDSGVNLAFCFIFSAAIFLFSLIGGCNEAHAYSDSQYCTAIYLAEGGAKAEYPYGIRSVTCAATTECKIICINTVRNNRQRYSEYGHKKFDRYLEFLGSRYCPVDGRGLTAAEKRVNQNWVKNVDYFLRRTNETALR